MAKIGPAPEEMSNTDDFARYHKQMWREIGALEKIAGELDEVSSVDIMMEWYKAEGARGLSRPEQLKMLLESFEKGILTHFREESTYIQELERDENLKNLAAALLKDHAKFIKELSSLRSQLKQLLAEKPGAVENLEGWKALLQNLRDLFNQIGIHAMQEQEIIFQISHNM